VLITPHYAGARPDYAAQASTVFLDNLTRYLVRQPLTNVVDPSRGY
jgi:phosphoglycerate dehydrogenase-like enzyme